MVGRREWLKYITIKKNPFSVYNIHKLDGKNDKNSHKSYVNYNIIFKCYPHLPTLYTNVNAHDNRYCVIFVINCTITLYIQRNHTIFHTTIEGVT